MQWVRREATYFATAAADRNEVDRFVLSDWSQPRRTGSLHSTLTVTRTKPLSDNECSESNGHVEIVGYIEYYYRRPVHWALWLLWRPFTVVSLRVLCRAISLWTSPPQSNLGKAPHSRTTTQQSIDYNGMSPNSPPKLLFPLWWSPPPSNTAIPQPTPLIALNNIWIQAVILPQYTFRTDRQTDRHTLLLLDF